MSVEVVGPPETPLSRTLSAVERPGLVEKLVIPGNPVSTTSGFMRFAKVEIFI